MANVTATVLATAGSVATALAYAYPIIDAFMKDKGSKRASRVRKQLNDILAKFNVKLEDLRNGIEQRGLRYNALIDKLQGSSPVGNAGRMKQRVERNYSKMNKEDLSTIRDINKQASAVSNEMEADAQRKENTGASELVTNPAKAIRTIFS